MAKKKKDDQAKREAEYNAQNYTIGQVDTVAECPKEIARKVPKAAKRKAPKGRPVR